ncbi:MAG: HAD-IIIA family hydrolase [Flavobacteriales bacterium]|nr:HAD-IIIA family hydrolase [Flavobacteriales bacterium]
MQQEKIVFLDRDGVINFDHGDYTFRQDQFTLLPEVLKFAQMAYSRHYRIVVITNQGGIAKGLYTWNDVHQLHAHMKDLFIENGTPLLDIFVSPDHDVVCNSISRKPEPLMIQRALYLYAATPEKCFMVGDKESDVACAKWAGIRGVQIQRNSSLMQVADLLV